MSADGRPALSPLPMFKLLLLQRWYGLSDPGLEDALRYRIPFIRLQRIFSFQSVTGLFTICRFRNTLLELNLNEETFRRNTNKTA
jgi:IS5 family transposase